MSSTDLTFTDFIFQQFFAPENTIGSTLIFLVMVVLILAPIIFMPSFQKPKKINTTTSMLRPKRLLWAFYILSFMMFCCSVAFFKSPIKQTEYLLWSILAITLLYSLSFVHFYWDDLQLTGCNFFLLKSRTIEWRNIQTFKWHPYLLCYSVKDPKGHSVFFPARFFYHGVPYLLEKLRSHSSSITLENITWEKIDQIIDKAHVLNSKEN
jgi:hypothetical protein